MATKGSFWVEGEKGLYEGGGLCCFLNQAENVTFFGEAICIGGESYVQVEERVGAGL
jgi:hypothetical protein